MPHSSPPPRRELDSPPPSRPPMPRNKPIATSTSTSVLCPASSSIQSPATRQRPKYRPAPVPPSVDPYPCPPTWSSSHPETHVHATVESSPRVLSTPTTTTIKDQTRVESHLISQSEPRSRSRSATKYQPSPRPMRASRENKNYQDQCQSQSVSPGNVCEPILPNLIPVPVSNYLSTTPTARAKTNVTPFSTPKPAPTAATLDAVGSAYFVSPPVTPAQVPLPSSGSSSFEHTSSNPGTPSSSSLPSQSMRRRKLLPAVSLSVNTTQSSTKVQHHYHSETQRHKLPCETKVVNPYSEEEKDDAGHDGEDEVPDLYFLRDRLPVLSPLSGSVTSPSNLRRRLLAPVSPRLWDVQQTATSSTSSSPQTIHARNSIQDQIPISSLSQSPARPKRSSYRLSSPLPTPISPTVTVPIAPSSPAPSSVLIRSSTPTSSSGSSCGSRSAELKPPRSTYMRAASPGDSILTITPSPTSTPKTQGRVPQEQSQPQSGPAASLPEAHVHSEPMRKRDSTQRRLSALRGLVATLDFHNPWSVSEKSNSENAEGCSFVWACSGPPLYTVDDVTSDFEEDLIESDHTNNNPTVMVPSSASATDSECSLQSPMRLSGEVTLPLSPIVSDHGWDVSSSPKLHTSPSVTSPNEYPFPRLPTPSPSASSLPSHLIRSSGTPGRRRGRRGSDIYTPEPPRPSRQRTQTFDVASSGFSKSLLLREEEEERTEDVTRSPIHGTQMTWRMAVGENEYARAVATSGSLEIKRQEVIWELCETEIAFVNSMRTVLRLFATPLRTPQGQWISGIPSPVTELFDCLEMITHVHSILSASQKDIRKRVGSIVDVDSFVHQLLDWIQRLETHEEYLIHFEPVVQLVEDTVRDPDSVFGEFVRMQMKDEVLGSMSLGSMLLKPVQRLTKYPLFFKRLLDATPTNHPSHSNILSLLAATETIILSLQSSKAREEDFQLLKLLESRLYGLPDNFSLAVRGRKLIAHGQINRLVPGKEASLSSSVSMRGRANSLHSSRGSFSSTVSSTTPSWACNPWDYSPGLSPSTCRTSAFSISSSGTFSQCGPSSRTNSLVHSSSSMSPVRTSVTRSPSATSSLTDHSHSRSPTPSSLRKVVKTSNNHHGEPLFMLIFDDIVLVAAVVHEKTNLFGTKKSGIQSMRVLPEHEGGIGKVVEVKDWTGWNGYNSLFSLTLSTLTGNHITSAFSIPSTTISTNPLVSISQAPPLHSVNQFIGTLTQTLATEGGSSSLSGVHGDETMEGKEVEELTGC